ncbi:hypothetical protein N7474_003670 [Penicillium riverlandense]|uniref:uncharacterized protein n=1 Tax=Penicillium riverlandense TaxID=1903569 RepID=UPI002547DA9E|nr:uncharacterized protein N7474_003670 [Penicillium riverlandense]KAJ5818079.1 hypothetical protein N7474_003670 [Penicillium riverlandense]
MTFFKAPNTLYRLAAHLYTRAEFKRTAPTWSEQVGQSIKRRRYRLAVPHPSSPLFQISAAGCEAETPCAPSRSPLARHDKDTRPDSTKTQISGSRTSDNDRLVKVSNDTRRSSVHAPLQVLVDACDQEQPLREESTRRDSVSVAPQSVPAGETNIRIPTTLASAEKPDPFVPSPGTDSSVASRVAPLSWFELLATDAANADNGFLLSPPQWFPSTPGDVAVPDPYRLNLQPRSRRERESFQAASFPRDFAFESQLVSRNTEGQSTASDEKTLWSTSHPIVLSDREHRIFRHFVRISSQWLDFYDPEKHFSGLVPRLALRNLGLMKALLALSARHLSLGSGMLDPPIGGTETDTVNGSDHEAIDRNVAVEYYYETLHYLNKAMQYSSYTHSPELIATALLISTYEMIDGSNQDWERHLKGVFWIQRFQDNDGESGGLRQAVWWAWLRQDVWVAMRERRRVFSFWQPKKPASALTAAELATRATYLLAQCVNYASKEEIETSNMAQRLERGSELLYMLQEWHDALPQDFSPLPIISHTEPFPPIWVHPPSYAAGLQIHSLARVLVILHRPSSGGYQDYRAAQKLLALSMNTICGIARTVDKAENAASLVSMHCLFGGKLSDLDWGTNAANLAFSWNVRV